MLRCLCLIEATGNIAERERDALEGPPEPGYSGGANMTKAKPNSPDFSELRSEAEDRFAAQPRESGQPSGYVEKLLHELQVHQIELELQNEELRNTQVQLRESLKQYSDLYDFAPVGYFTLGKDGVILEVNLAGSALFSADRSSLIGNRFQSFLVEEYADAFYFHERAVFKSGTKQRCEIKLRKSDGATFDAQVESLAVENRDGTVTRCRTILFDITERKQAEQGLHQIMEHERERAEELETVLQAVPAYVWIAHDPECLHITGNRAADEFLRLPYGAEASLTAPEKLRPSHFKLFKDGREMMGDELPVQQAARGTVVKDFEYNVAFSDGAICHVLGNAMPLLDKQGRPRGSVAAFVDITERKKMEDVIHHAHGQLEELVRERTAELVRANAQLSREIVERQQSQTVLLVERDKFRKLSQEFNILLNAISDALVLLSPDMKILWTNCENVQPVNEALSKVARQYCHELLHDLSAPSKDSPVRRCFNDGEEEVSVVIHNGAILNVRAFPIKDGDRVSSVLLLASDITEKMALQAEAMQACHLASLGELAAGIAHEINNPITGIINYGQILINECSAERMENDIGKRIVKEGERIGRIVKTLLSYARDDQRERKIAASVPAILEESIILTQAQIRKEGIDLKINLLDDLPEVDVNFQQIQQSFINIISNARYALSEKYPRRHKNKLLEITGEKVMISDRPYVRIVFHDHGVGISPHELPMLTKAFFTTKPFGKGTGLGLSITERIIADHGGFLSFESIKGEFTKAIIDLPAKVNNECQDSCN